MKPSPSLLRYFSLLNHYLKVLSLFFLLCIFVGCDDEKVAPVSEVSSIYPLEGQAGTSVKIRGKNLKGKKTSVFFHGVEALVLNVSDTLLEVSAPENSGTGQIEVIVDSKSISGPEFKFYSFYYYGRNSNKAMYWRDGIPFEVHENGYINDLAVVGNDIYALGKYYTPILTAKSAYWKNGVLVELENTDQSTVLTGIAVSGSDVHICGHRAVPYPGYNVSMYWKNGKLVYEEPIREYVSSRFYDIALAGNDVYIVGDDYPEAIVWKNGVKTVLPGRTAQASASKIRVFGSDVYVSGSDMAAGGQYKARFWKNQVEVPFTGENNFSATDFTFKNGEPVFVGYRYKYDTGFTPLFYQAGVLNPINQAAQGSNLAIEVADNTTYILVLASGYPSILLKNGTNIAPPLSEGGSAFLRGISIVYY